MLLRETRILQPRTRCVKQIRKWELHVGNIFFDVISNSLRPEWSGLRPSGQVELALRSTDLLVRRREISNYFTEIKEKNNI